MGRPATQSAQSLNFTHRDKIFFPKPGYTKGDLIDYYQKVARVMLPYINDRPHSLLRHPNGVNGQSFFQKDMENVPAWITIKKFYSESNQKYINYLVATNSDSLLYMVQLGCIEINPWNSRVQNLDKPDWIVIDLDPETIGFDKVTKTALAIKKFCDEIKIPTYPKTSGKSGIHIYIPMGANYTYDQCKKFAEIIARTVQSRLPKITSIERSPAKRQRKVYIDFLQNHQGQTLAAPYSVRPTPEATVSTPLLWKEVNKRLKPTQFTVKTIRHRLSKIGDIWKPVLGKGINLPKVLKKLAR